jgi:hypothetical protein
MTNIGPHSPKDTVPLIALDWIALLEKGWGKIEETHFFYA